MTRLPILALLCSLAASFSAAPVSSASPEENTSGSQVPPIPEFTKETPEAYGLALAKYMDLYDTGWRDQYSTSHMTLFDARGDSVKRTVVQMLLEGVDGDKSIVKFQSPAEIKGVAALTHEHPATTDDNWLYLPASRRVRRISGANKTASFQGTEFTYEDLSNLVIRKYDWQYLEDADLQLPEGKVPVYELEARPNYRDTAYSRLVVYVHRQHWRVERVDFYDKSKRLLKVRRNIDWRLRHGRFWRPAAIEMDNQQTKKRTRIDVRNEFLNLSLYKSKRTGKSRKNLTERHFTTRAIEGS